MASFEEEETSIFDDNDSVTTNVDSEEDDVEPLELFKRFIREAIEKLSPEQSATILADRSKLNKVIRHNLGFILTDKFEIVERWDDDKNLTRLQELVQQYQKDEDVNEYHPAIMHALQQRKEIVNTVIDEVLQELSEEDNDG